MKTLRESIVLFRKRKHAVTRRVVCIFWIVDVNYVGSPSSDYLEHCSSNIRRASIDPELKNDRRCMLCNLHEVHQND